MAACAFGSWPLPIYPANPWDRTQNLTETVLFSGAKGSGSPGNIIGPVTEELPCAGTLLVLLARWVLIFTNLLLSLPPFYRLTLGGFRLLQKHQTWISDAPAWPSLIQVRDCNHRALSTALLECAPPPRPAAFAPAYPWNCLPPAPNPRPTFSGKPCCCPLSPLAGLPISFLPKQSKACIVHKSSCLWHFSSPISHVLPKATAQS